MLKFFREIFEIKPELWTEVIDPLKGVCFIDYRNKLIQEGFVFRKNCFLYFDTGNRNIILNGILGHANALDDARVNSELSSIQSEIELNFISNRFVKYFDCIADDLYCEHNQWDSILLINYYIDGAPSLVCGECRGLIASYRLNLSLETSRALWRWERQCDAISDLSILCSEYESWGDDELHNINSKINKLGAYVASAISKEIGCNVNLVMP